jgi:two-component system, OmpR family, sensor histidine kinase QseC
MKHSFTSIIQFFRTPSLARRGFLFIALAFLVIWAVLLAYNYAKAVSAAKHDPSLAKYAIALSDSLKSVQLANEAIAVIKSTDQWTNTRRKDNKVVHGQMHYALYDSNLKFLYGSDGIERFGLSPMGKALETQMHSGAVLRIVRARTAEWHIVITEPTRTDAQILLYNSEVILPNLLIALPFVLFTVWLSVSLGLRPLSQLAQKIRARNESDLSPLDFSSNHRELRPLVQSLDSLLSQLSTKVEHERAFVQDAAHELRTPLAVISAQGHVLANAQSPLERKQAQEFFDQAIQRASHLSAQLLSLAAMDDSTHSAPSVVDLAHNLRQSLAQEAPRTLAKQIELSLEAPDNLLAKLDNVAFESISRNLLDNAIRYTRVHGAISVTLSEDADVLHLKLQDDGPGITSADGVHIFERFYRAAGVSSTGSGLGLAIVKQAALRLGGSVRMIPGIQNKGVGFHVQIPKKWCDVKSV